MILLPDLSSDEEMTKGPKDWEDEDSEQPIIDLDDIDYDQFLLKFLDLEEVKPKEAEDESSKQLECYMCVQDPEPPQEEFEKLALNCPTPSAGDVTVPNASFETNNEARLCLLCQNDLLKAENNHLCQQLEQSWGQSPTRWQPKLGRSPL